MPERQFIVRDQENGHNHTVMANSLVGAVKAFAAKYQYTGFVYVKERGSDKGWLEYSIK